MRTRQIGALVASALCIGGCATGNGELPLTFGSAQMYGVSMGGGADTGGEFVVGFKSQNFAIVPVSGVSNGAEEFVGASTPAGDYQESYSVLAHFDVDSAKKKKGAGTRLGKFFATGAAAQNISVGFRQQMGYQRPNTTTGCFPAPAAGSNPGGAAAPPSSGAAPAATRKAVARAAANASGSREAARLVFAQYQYKALAIDGSALESGLKFSLGVRDRSVALIPVMGRDAQGNLIHIQSDNPRSGPDALSVLGRFESDDEVDPAADRTIDSNLASFFATGVAASNLSNGFHARLCDAATQGGSQHSASASPADAAAKLQQAAVRK